MDSLKAKFRQDGYVIARSDATRSAVAKIKHTFEENFRPRFEADPLSNRNLIKRFADSIEIASLFACPELVGILQSIGIQSPVYCGPVVSHYTHIDPTGNSYGLPWHQDYPSMASSSNSAIVWFSVNACNANTHSIQVAPRLHSAGLLGGEQRDNGYILDAQQFANSLILDIQPGDILVFSSYLPHCTFVNPESASYKLSFSRRFDDLQCPDWPERKFANAYGVSVDRSLYQSQKDADYLRSATATNA